MKVAPTDRPSADASRSASRIRPLDGIVFAARADRRRAGNWVRDTWVLAFSDREQIADFFLEDEAAPAGGEVDPMPWVCRSVRRDGTVVLGSVNLRDDHFLSEIFSARGEEE